MSTFRSDADRLLGRGEHWQAVAAWVVVCTVVLRLIYLGQVQLIPEETYYWNYAQHPALGYLDHPPMVAWLIKVGTTLFGDTEFGVRFGALVSAAIASFFVFRLTRNLFGQSSALVSLVLMQVLPFFFLSGMLMTPDAPLTAAWAAALYFLERALLGGERRGWVSAGASVGLGLLSKYTIGLLVPAAFVFCLWDPSSRSWLRRWQPYAACLLALVLFCPVILWNAEHHWMSFAFQTTRRLAEKPQFGLPRLILSALVLLTPTGFLTLAIAAFGRDRVSPEGAGIGPQALQRRRWRFVLAMVLVPLSVFLAFSLRHDVKIDWTGALWVAVMPALAQVIVSFGQTGSTRLRRWAHASWIPTVLVLLLAYGVALQYLVVGLPHVGYSRHVELVPVAWRDLGQQISAAAAELRARSGAVPVVVGMDRYVVASELAFYARDGRNSLRDTAGRHLFDLDALMYELWDPPGSLQGRTLLLVGWAPEQLADGLVAPHVARLEPIHEGTLERDGSVISHFYYRAAYGFH